MQKLKNKYPSIYDSDEIQDPSDWFGRDRKPVEFPKNADKKWLKEHEFLWDLKVLKSSARASQLLLIIIFKKAHRWAIFI